MASDNDRFLGVRPFARVAEVSPSYIDKMIKQGRIIRDDATGKIDRRHPVNSGFLEAARATKAPAEPTEDSGDDTIRSLQHEKLRLENERLRAQARRYQLQNAETTGRLLPADAVMEYAGAFGSGVRTYMLPLPDRLAARVLAISQAGGGIGDVRELIGSELSTAISRALEMGDAAVERLKAANNTEEIDDDDEHNDDT